MSERIDKLMLDRKMVKSRSQARMLIKQGDVLCNGEKVRKPGQMANDTDQIEIKQRNLYVSRGAFKLLQAIEEFKLDFSEKVVADCGASTGGFTQVALQNGASKVYAIDVGHDQLDELVKQNPSVINMEGINLKNPLELPEKVDIAVADLSFISIKLVYPTMDSLLKNTGYSVILIKPQFEAGRERLGKNAIVKEEFQQEILDEVIAWFDDNNFVIDKFCDSPISGKTGNKEYLALVYRK
ncbi:MAG: 23S rRNA (cytidine1920-2'-O)/16S rRNA (cytidine1409-2'-O)-methyltransferase [Bacteriovoracaceae bacterium]|jgi:23S rRNA (cytidine1920-2'-O)/16S rRNA (cytidine1409-2'-O)-methyltransferase